MAGGQLPLAGSIAAELSDSEATRRVLLTAAGLLLIGLALLVATVWWWRGTRPDHPVLAPLEVMSDRRWIRADLGEKRRLIDTSRPVGSLPAVADPAAPDPDDLSVPVPAVARAPDDLDELDMLLGLAPRRGEAPRQGPGPSQGAAGAGVAERGARREIRGGLDDGQSAGQRIELFGSDPAGGVERHDGDGDDAAGAAIDPLLQRTSAVAKD